MYHKGAQLVSVIAGSTAVVIILFAETIIQLWTQDNELAIQTKNLVQLLTLGNLLNGLMWIPYQTQMAYGWTCITLRINTISVLLIIPAILWVTPKYGPEGAA
jgi:O-antigen/teichoic acid export membrane protein